MSVFSKYCLQFGLMAAAALLAAALGVSSPFGKIVLVWVAASFSVIAIAYGLGRPSLLMKRRDGSQPLLAWFILLPYFMLTRVSFLLYRLSSRGKVPVAEALPGIWFARRLTKRELGDTGVQWAAVLDLAAEFPRVKASPPAYKSLPMLDGAVPSESQLREAVAWVREQAACGPVLVHCALGHGRTGAVVVTWLLAGGHVANVEAAVAHLTARRSTFGMSKAQVEFVRRFASNHLAT